MGIASGNDQEKKKVLLSNRIFQESVEDDIYRIAAIQLEFSSHERNKNEKLNIQYRRF